MEVHSQSPAVAEHNLPYLGEGALDEAKEPLTRSKRERYTQYAFVLLMFVAAFAGVTLEQESLPTPRDKTSNPSLFSGESAYEHLKIIAKEPHPSGTAANTAVMNIIVESLTALKGQATASGKNLQIRLQKHSYKDYGSKRAGLALMNILAKLEGDRPEALMLSAHYDTVHSSPGATDDSSGVAIILEVLRAMIMSPKQKYSLVCSFNDGEERGALGSQAHSRGGPWFDDITAFLNLEGGGGGGKALLFRVTDYDLLSHYRHVPHPHCSVIGNDVYNTGVLPSYTDYDVYAKQKHIRGADMAFYRRRGVYHTRHDTLAHISAGSLQQSGDNVLSMTKSILDSDLLVNKTSQSLYDYPVYYHIPGKTMLIMSRVSYQILNVVAGAIAIASIILAVYVSLKHRQPFPIQFSAALKYTALLFVALVLHFIVSFSILALIFRPNVLYGHDWLFMAICAPSALLAQTFITMLATRWQRVTVDTESSIDTLFGSSLLASVFCWALLHIAGTTASFRRYGFSYISFWYLFFEVSGLALFCGLHYVHNFIEQRQRPVFGTCLKYMFNYRFALTFFTCNVFPFLLLLDTTYLLTAGLSGHIAKAPPIAMILTGFNVLASYLMFMNFGTIDMLCSFRTKLYKIGIILLLVIFSIIYGCVVDPSTPSAPDPALP